MGAVQLNLQQKLKSCLNWGTKLFFWEEMAENSDMQYKPKKYFGVFLSLRHEEMTIGTGEETSLSATSTLLKVKVIQNPKYEGIGNCALKSIEIFQCRFGHIKWEMVSVEKERELN